jgi:hypothetical protein
MTRTVAIARYGRVALTPTLLILLRSPQWVMIARESGRVPDSDLSEPERTELERLRKESRQSAQSLDP